MTMKLYSWTNMHFFLFPVQIAAGVAGVNCELVIPTEEMKEDADFKAKKAHGKYPMLETADGKILFESVAIASYFARIGKGNLLGNSAFQEAEINFWLSYATSKCDPALRAIVYNVFGFTEDKAVWEKGIKDFGEILGLFEKHLTDKSWLVGNTLTLADIMCFGMMKVPFAFVMGAEQREQCPAVSAWFEKMGTLPVVTMVTGTNAIAEEAWKCCGSDLTVTVAAQVEAATEEVAGEGDDDDIDMFGSDDEDDEASFDALCKAKQAAIDKANAKPKATAKSIVMFEVKPLESETDLDALFARILKECVIEGCNWKQDCKKEPVAFGVFKLIVGAVIEDDKVSTDDIEEQIEGMDDMVQSVDIQSFNKL
jgi:elongation factor 1-beta